MPIINLSEYWTAPHHRVVKGKLRKLSKKIVGKFLVLAPDLTYLSFTLWASVSQK